MNEIADFILRYDLIYRKWDKQLFLDWLQWHADHQLLLKAIDLDGSIAGVLIIRTVMKPNDTSFCYAYDPEGDVAFVELGIATKPGVIQALVFAALKRFGERPFVAWKRPPFFITTVYSSRKVLRLFLGHTVHSR